MASSNDGGSRGITDVPGRSEDGFSMQNNFINANGYAKGPTKDSSVLIDGPNSFNVNGYVKDPTLDFDFLLKEFDHEFDLVNYINTDHSQKLNQNHPPSPSSSTASETERILNMVMPKGLNTVEQEQNSIDIDANLAAPDNSVTTMSTPLIEQHSVISCDQINKADLFLHSTQQNACGKTRRRRNTKTTTEIQQKKAERRKKNNLASKELRQRRKEDSEKLTKQEMELEYESKELRDKVKSLEGGINVIISVFDGISRQLIQSNSLQFRENFLNLIRLLGQAGQSGDVTSQTAIGKLLQVYRNQVDRTMDDKAKNKLLQWLKFKLDVHDSW
eukprot:TCONS_00068153-protein